MKILALLFMLACSGAHADSWGEWSTLDRRLFVATVAMTAVDYRQTWASVPGSTRFVEANPMLGEHPSRGRIATAFALNVAAITFLSFELPKYRTIILGAKLTTESIAVIHNHMIGLRMNF